MRRLNQSACRDEVSSNIHSLLKVKLLTGFQAIPALLLWTGTMKAFSVRPGTFLIRSNWSGL